MLLTRWVRKSILVNRTNGFNTERLGSGPSEYSYFLSAAHLCFITSYNKLTVPLDDSVVKHMVKLESNITFPQHLLSTGLKNLPMLCTEWEFWQLLDQK